MKKALKVIGWIVGIVVALALFENAPPWLAACYVIGALNLYLYRQLSKQIDANHLQVTRMVENTYRAAAGLPRDD